MNYYIADCHFGHSNIIRFDKRPCCHNSSIHDFLLYGYGSYVLDTLHMPHCNPVGSLKSRSVYGAHLLDHLAADGAGFPGSQVAVVAIGQINAHFLGSLHLETVHGLASLGDVDLVVVGIAHFDSLLCFLRKKLLPEESIFVPWS